MSARASHFLKITVVAGDKPILGEATDAEYRHQIEVDGWGWDLTRASEASSLTKIGSTSPPPANAVTPSTLKFDKTMCRATSGMLSALRSGAMLKAVFSLEEDSDTDFLLRVKLEKARLLSYDLRLDGTAVKESWTLNYSDITFDYGYKDKGRLTVKLSRPSDAPTTAPSDNSAEGKLEALAKKIEPEKLGPLLTRLQSDLSKSALRPAATARPTSVTKPTVPVKKF